MLAREVLPARRRPRLLRATVLALCGSVALLTGMQQCHDHPSRLDYVVRMYSR